MADFAHLAEARWLFPRSFVKSLAHEFGFDRHVDELNEAFGEAEAAYFESTNAERSEAGRAYLECTEEDCRRGDSADEDTRIKITAARRAAIAPLLSKEMFLATESAIGEMKRAEIALQRAVYRCRQAHDSLADKSDELGDELAPTMNAIEVAVANRRSVLDALSAKPFKRARGRPPLNERLRSAFEPLLAFWEKHRGGITVKFGYDRETKDENAPLSPAARFFSKVAAQAKQSIEEADAKVRSSGITPAKSVVLGPHGLQRFGNSAVRSVLEEVRKNRAG